MSQNVGSTQMDTSMLGDFKVGLRAAKRGSSPGAVRDVSRSVQMPQKSAAKTSKNGDKGPRT